MSTSTHEQPITGSLDVVRTESGLLEGTTSADGALRIYKGIPYAAPPVGELRWRPPLSPPAWEGVRRADSFGPICPQHPVSEGSFYQLEFYPEPEPQSEDCLFLNIWTAAQSGEERRPVMVWFHGGAFVEGSGSLPSFHGETLARKGAVLVTVNYRLGVFGYFAHSELTAESEHGASGNYGLHDQIAALRWVRDNIAAFGGDPSNVTIFGQSAGSASVCMLLCSPLAAGLFHRAITQSGGPYSFRMHRPNTPTLADGERNGQTQARRWGAESLAELRALPVQTLLGAGLAEYRMSGNGPVVDGWAVPEAPERALAGGLPNRVPLLLGATANEFSTLTVSASYDPEGFRRQAEQRFGERAAEFLAMYPPETDQNGMRSLIASGSDELFAGMRAMARFESRHSPGNVFLYYFDRRLPGRNSEFYGAFHSGDLYYVFDTLDSTDRPWDAIDRRLADQMTSYWTNFAANGDPNGPGLPHWPAYTAQQDELLELGDQVRAIPSPKQQALALFDRITAAD